MKKFFVLLLAKIKWEWVNTLRYGRHYSLKLRDHRKIMEVLNQGNYIILTRRNTHLTTYATCLSNLLLTGRWGYWSHACMNIDRDIHKAPGTIKILEAVGSGVKVSGFYEVFDCDSVCILKPLCPEGLNWEDVIDEGISSIGKKYDTDFKLGDASKMSCVEVVFDAIKKVKDYKYVFHGLLAMIKLEKNLTPDMYYDCGSFEVLLEIRR